MINVFVTGMGLVSALGSNVNENLKGLRSGQTGIKKSRFFASKYAETHFFGEVNKSTETLIESIKLTSKLGLTRTDILAMIAFNEAIHDAGLAPEEISSFDTAFISASTVGGMCAHDELFADAQLPEKPSVYLFSYPFAAHALKIIEEFKIRGISNTINTACSSSANAITMGTKLIQSGRVKRAIVGGADSLSKYTANGFNALRILSDDPCRPFDTNRKGLSLGEGAAYLVLEAEEQTFVKKKYARISGFSNTSDAFHLSSLSEEAEGVKMAIEKALTSAGLKPGMIDYINTHGTGTENNDKVELLGLSKVFGLIPPYNATKSYTGHSLGAAGSMEAIIALLSLNYKELYPSLYCENPIDEQTPPLKKYQNNVDIKHVLSNSFGFGSNCTSLIFSKI
ncbi:MAG: beta-ketoacyl-[acyl-carrier-protein] synthase family protein [Bacteroidales bacterium]|nr:beta-ketoacyl-[acyl-carrier-protein] synthase family protein [Bacteroidales bacterium]